MHADPKATHVHRRRTLKISEAQLAREAAAFLPIQLAANELTQAVKRLPDGVQRSRGEVPMHLMMQVGSLQMQVTPLPPQSWFGKLPCFRSGFHNRLSRQVRQA